MTSRQVGAQQAAPLPWLRVEVLAESRRGKPRPARPRQIFRSRESGGPSAPMQSRPQDKQAAALQNGRGRARVEGISANMDNGIMRGLE
jgi:hypothetical protein